jgi:peptidoglycan/LPS O-acetylase OafA/YrhL
MRKIVTSPSSLPIEWGVNNFDLIRLLAALQVAMVHIITHLQPSVPGVAVIDFALRLFPGVPVFFVISGFLISRSFEQASSLKQYCRNRCLRIFPAMWICLLVSVGAMMVCGASSIGAATTTDWLVWWAAQMSAFQSYWPQYLQSFGVGQLNPSLWTIPVELEFYLLLPGIYSLLRLRERRGSVLLLTLLTASLAIRIACADGRVMDRNGYSRYVLITIVPHLWMFLYGVLAQRHWQTLRHWVINKVHWWLLAYLLVRVIAARLRLALGGLEINPILLLPLSGLVMSGAMSARALSRSVLHDNDISYGTYIYHMPTVNVIVQIGAPSGAWSVATALAVSLGAAVLSWKYIEKPFLRRKRRSMRADGTAPGRADDLRAAATAHRDVF